MDLGERIEQRRKKVGLSQAELARRVGVRQSTMNSLVNGNSRTSRSLLKIARELGTTAAYLTGETDDPESDVPAYAMTADERDLVDLYRALGPGEKSAVATIVRTMATSARSPTVNDQGRGFRG